MSSADVPDSFTAALSSGVAADLVPFPRADRHCHSLLGASLSSIRRWARAPVEPPSLPFANFDQMRRYAHEALYRHIRTREGFEFTAEQAIREAVDDGISILEMSLDVDFAGFYPGLPAFLDFVHGLVSRYRARIRFRPELGISRNREPSGQIRSALECIDSLLFASVDLYGNEDAREPAEYRFLYQRAGSKGLKLKAHVGEFGDCARIERTLRALNLREIQHGVTAVDSRSLMTLLRDEQIRLNVCPSSNVALSVSRDIAHHQIRVLVDNGVRVSINSDDKTIFGNSVSEEYLALHRAGTLSAPELEAIREDSLRD